jgi:hypothetical protein
MNEQPDDAWIKHVEEMEAKLHQKQPLFSVGCLGSIIGAVGAGGMMLLWGLVHPSPPCHESGCDMTNGLIRLTEIVVFPAFAALVGALIGFLIGTGFIATNSGSGK